MDVLKRFLPRQTGPLAAATALCLSVAAIAAMAALAAPAAAQPQTGHIELTAARAKTGERSEVRLLWLVTEGWLPTGGINVFRSDQPDRPLNPSPILLDPRLLDPDAGAKIQNVVSGKPLFGAAIAARASATLSSRAAFSAFKSEIQRLQTQPGIRGAQINAQAAKVPEVVSYRTRLLPPQAAPQAAKAPLTADEKTVSTRIQVLLTALTNYRAAQKLGLAFIDTTALPGTAYTYTLRAAPKGVGSGAVPAVGIAQVVVPVQGQGGESVTPPPPTGLDVVQTGQSSVALHWEPMTAADEEKLSGATYNVFRDGTKRNKSPIRIPFLPTTDGAHIAPMTSFIDTDAPLGAVHYTVTLTDAFGRTSTPALASAIITDLRVPAPINRVAAAVSQTTPGAIRLYWIAPDIYTGDIPITVGPDLTQNIPDTAAAIYRAEAGQAETPLATASGAVLSDLNLTLSTGPSPIPPDIADLTTGDFFTLAPEFAGELTQTHLGGSQAIAKAVLNALRDKSVDRLYAVLDLDRKMRFYRVTRTIRSYLDTTGTPDRDYRYHLVPGYTINPGHFGTGSFSVSLAVPTKAAPAAPAGFGGVFAKGIGKFGFVEDGAAPTIRRLGVSGAESEKPRVVETVSAKPGVKAARKAVDAAPPLTIAGRVTLNWQASPFTSKVRYRVFRAAATGLFPAAQTASVGAPPVIPTLQNMPKIGGSQRASMAAVIQQRHQYRARFSPNFTGVPNQNYALLAVTDRTQFVDTVPVSQRMHYDYRVVPVSRWGVEGSQTPVADVAIPATLPPSLPTLLKAQVEEAIADGHVRLTVSASPLSENVAKYLVFRKPISEVLQAVQSEHPPVRVAAAHGFAVPPPAPSVAFAPGKARNLGVRDLRANGGLVLRHLLEPEGYVKIGEIPASATGPQIFIDTTGRARTPFAYQVVAVNSDAIASKPSSPLDATALKVHCDPPRGFAATPDSSEIPEIKLTWQVPAPDAPAHYVLERATERLPSGRETGKTQAAGNGTGTGVFVTLSGDIEPGVTQFSDTSIRSGRRYLYRLRAVDSEGLFSDPQARTVIIPALAPADFGDPARAQKRPPVPDVTPVNPIPGPMPVPQPVPGPVPIPVPIPGGGSASVKPASRRARFGESYLVGAGAGAGAAFAVRVEKAAYSINSYAIDPENYYYCRPDERFIKLTLRVRNSSAEPQAFDYQTLTAHTVSADNSALEGTRNWKALDTGRLANRTVAPGQEFVIEGVVIAPAGTDPREIAFGDCAFDLADTANALPALAVAAEQPAPLRTPCPLAYTVGTVESANRVGAEYVVTVTARNATLAPLTLGPQSLGVEVFDTDGDKYAPEPGQIAQTTLAPGASARLRFVFKVPGAAPVHQIKLREKDSRVYVLPGEK